MSAVLFGSIGTLADTSELQRAAFNEAFAAHGLRWSWSREEYRRLLQESGGERRIAAYARSVGDEVDAAAVHATKSERFRDALAAAELGPRPGVAETIAEAERDGLQVALVTTTSADNVAALADALRPRVELDDFALVVDRDSVEHPKPAPDAYRFALHRLGVQPGDCVAIEDNVGGVRAAVEAGVPCVAFPGENNADHDFAAADRSVQALTLADVRTLMAER